MRAWGYLLLSTVLAFACRRSSDEKPVSALATSSESETKFDAIRVRWEGAGSEGRAALRNELHELLVHLVKKGDALEPIVRAYLAIAWLDAGVPAAAEAVARPLIDGPPGVANDLAVLVHGAVARRSKKPQEAIELLRPLVGKLIDAFARPLLYEEIIEAFLDLGSWEEALAYAEGWLRSAAPSEKKETRAKIARVLARIPENVAARVLDENHTAPPEAKHSPEIVVILSARLDHGGVPGSPVLLEDGGTVAAFEDGGPLIPDVSFTGAPVVTTPVAKAPYRFDPRTFALLVPSSLAGLAAPSTAMVRAAAMIGSPMLATVMHADGGTGNSAPTGHRLAVFDSGGTAATIAIALDAAEREGAGVVIGGVTDRESNALAALAQARRVPVVLLRRPSSPPTLGSGERQWWISVGPSMDEERKATLAVAQVAASDLAIVEAWPEVASNEPPSSDPLHARCDATPKTAGAPAFPIAAWKAKKTQTIVVLGDGRCARKVAEELAPALSAGWHPTLILAPSALELAHVPIALSRTVLGAGSLPADDKAPPPLRTLWLDQGAPVGWWSGLGHDAAVLATSALPGDLVATDDTLKIQQERAKTLARLSAAKGALWTTSQQGPGPSGIVARTMEIRVIAAGSASTPAWAP